MSLLTCLILEKAFWSVHFSTLTSHSWVLTHLSLLLCSEFSDKANDDFRFLDKSEVALALSELHFSSSMTSRFESLRNWVSPDHFYYLCGLMFCLLACDIGSDVIVM